MNLYFSDGTFVFLILFQRNFHFQDFDPATRRFSEEELKPQPIIRKRKKQFVPDELKNNLEIENITDDNIDNIDFCSLTNNSNNLDKFFIRSITLEMISLR